jgi:glycosyltransferase involved in cell wall biosynthesis
MIPLQAIGPSPTLGPHYLFTVFTPTHNRASTLPRVYDSLKPQTLRDFEWLVVDDGSTDNTRELVEKWRAEANFPIRYVYQPNQGKPTASNRGVQEAAGELFLTLDSDDSCLPQALERLKFHWDSIPENERPRFSAVTALCQNQHGEIVGDKFARDVLDSDEAAMFMSGTRGEKWGFQRTDVLRQYPFPVTPEAKFVPESVVWLALSRQYKTRFVNEVLRTYYTRDGAQDHLSSLSVKVLWGRAFFYRQVLNEFVDWALRAPICFIRCAINFSRYSFGLGKGPLSQWKELNNLRAKLLLSGSLPLGFAMYLRDKRSVQGGASE